MGAMQQDLNKAITRAIQLGEAKAKAIQERAFSNIGAMKKALQGEIAERVERMGDRVFKTINHNRAKSANNYLAVKGYAGATRSRIVKYIQSGRGRNLLSVGDFLQSVALFSSIRTKAAYGVGAGATKVLPACGGAWDSASISWERSPSPCKARASLPWAKWRARQASGCMSLAMPLASPTG